MSTSAVEDSDERSRGLPPENPWQMANRGTRRAGRRNDQTHRTDSTVLPTGTRGINVGPTVDGLGNDAPTFGANAGNDEEKEMDVERVNEAENINEPATDDPDVLPIRVEFKMPKNTNKSFNIVTAHANFINILKKADAKLMIITKKTPITNLRSFPETKGGYDEDFDWFSDTFTEKTTVIHKIKTKLRFIDLRFNAEVMEYMQKEKIYMSINKNGWLKTSAHGFLKFVHPTTAWRETITSGLKEAIFKNSSLQEKQELTKGEMQAGKVMVNVIPKTVRHFDGNQFVQTYALEINSPFEIRDKIREILAKVAMKEQDMGVYIPYALAKEIGKEQFGQHIRSHTQYMQNMRVITVYGISPEAMKVKIKTNEGNTTVMEYLQSTKEIKKIEETQKSSESGKYFIETTQAEIKDAQKDIDHKIAAIYATNIIPQAARYVSMPKPYRANNKQTTETIKQYVQHIKAPTEEQYSEAKARFNTKSSRQRSLTFSRSNFPDIQRNQNEGEKNQKKPSNTNRNAWARQPNIQRPGKNKQDEQAVERSRGSILTEDAKNQINNMFQNFRQEIHETINNEIVSMYERMRNEMRTTIQETILQLFQSSPDKITEMMEMSNKRTNPTNTTQQNQKKQARQHAEGEQAHQGGEHMETEKTSQSNQPTFMTLTKLSRNQAQSGANDTSALDINQGAGNQ